MPGRQQTFDLVPATLVRATAKPPMTSKAAKKAYQKANRVPRLSRAEQRRLEAEELAQQKAEYEKERNTARAKAAREKKSQKEKEKKDARKKMGLPEPSRFVRPSQPTISRFVMANGKRSWQQIEAAVEDSGGRPHNPEDDGCPPTKRAAVEDASDEEFGDFPSLSQSDLPGLLDCIDNRADSPRRQEEPEEPSQRTTPDKEENTFDDDQIAEEMVTAQLLSETAEASSKLNNPQSFRLSPTRSSTRSKRSNHIVILVDKESTSENGTVEHCQAPRVSRQALEERSANIQPPPKVTRAISFAQMPQKPRDPVLDDGKTNMPPSATQAFLEDHIEDFFPSPSQEIRELLEGADDLPSNTQITRELNSATKPAGTDFFGDMPLSQEFLLSSQDILEITTPSRAQPPAPAPQEKRRFFEEKEEDLLQAALHESKMAAKQEPPLKKPPGSKRTLQRVQSAATDYGDEEFSAYEKELLAMF